MPQIVQLDYRQPCARGFDGERPAELKAGYPLPLPEPYDQPVFTRVKVVHRDYHAEVARPLYSVPEHLLGSSLDARVDSQRGSFPRLAPSSRHKEGDD